MAGIDGADRDTGWEDLCSPSMHGTGIVHAHHGGSAGTMSAPAAAGRTGTSGEEFPGGFSDSVTGAMVGHFAREFAHGSLSLWPQVVQSTRQYFNVTHGYVLRKALWQLAPMPSKKKKAADSEINAQKDWTVRISHGLEVDIEVPDAYIPVMGFVTYVVLSCLIQGLQERFHPDMLSSTLTYSVVVLFLEAAAAKAALFVAGAVDAPVIDLFALLGYKYYYLSIQLIISLMISGGYKPSGFFYLLLTCGLTGCCSIALWQVLRRLPRMQPAPSSQDRLVDMHTLVIKAIPASQVIIYWFLLPSWSIRPRVSTTLVTTAAAAVFSALGNVTGAAVP